jgi:hypothetical protein
MAVEFSPLAAIGSPRWRPCFLPTGGHEFSPWCGGSRGLDGAKAVGRSGIESPRRVQLSRGSTPSPAVAWASR